jgi:hypothetical protein
VNQSTYSHNVGTPNRRPVSTYSGDESRDLPHTYAQAAQAFERAQKRRGGAKGRVAYCTTIRAVVECCGRDLSELSGGSTGCAVHGIRAVSYAVRLHDTDVVTFLPSGSVALDSGGWQTFTTRDRMNRCGVLASMDSGVPTVRLLGCETRHPYVDGMVLHRNGTASYPQGREPRGTHDEIVSRRRRALAAERRAYARDETPAYIPRRWDLRSGGYTSDHGTVREVFRTDEQCGLKQLNRKTQPADASKVGEAQS